MKKILIYLLLQIQVIIVFAQSAFNLDKTTICLSEDLLLSNTSINATSYEWDFCLGDFSVEPTTSDISVTELLNGFGVELVEDGGMYYGFVVDNSRNKLIRLDYGSNPLNTSPSIVDLQDPGTILSSPEDISMIQYGGNWYGVVGYEDNGGSITRLDFGTSLTNTPTETSLGNFGFTGRIRNVGLEEVDGSLLLLFTHYNTNELVIVNYDNSFDKVIDNATDVYRSGAISDLRFTTGFDFRQLSNGNYVAHLVSIADEDVVRLDYGTDLFSTPTQSATYTLSGLTASYNFQMLEEGGSYYGVIGSSDQAIKLYDFGDLTTTQQPVELSYTTALPTNEAFALYRYEGSSYFKGIDRSTITDLSFVASCDASISSSTDETPTGVNYGTAGSYELQLYAFDSDGDVTTATETVTVLNQSAPAIDFTINDSQCISSDNVFTPSNTGLSTYNWTLGDGNSSTDVTPTHRYAAAGTYSVILEVSDGTCTNTSTETLTIYDDPPTPTFTVTNSSGSLCSNTELTLDNTTDETGYDDALTYRWLIDGDQAFQADTVYTFTTSGDKTITLQSFVPGCSSTITEEVITIGDGPEVSFSYTNNCFGSPVEFTGEAVGSGVSSYTWDFGDGSATETGSALTSPIHTYSTAGSYTVTLSVSNSDGCTTISTQDITVTDADLVSFTNSEATENTLINFTGVDETVAGDAVTSWSWDFAGEGSSTDQSPTFTFTAPGSYDVSVTVNTDQGCSSTVTETITVAEAAFPTAAFTLGDTELCLSEDLQLTNTSINATSYEWDFCLGDFAVEPTTSEYSITGLSNGFGVELLEDEGMYYGFVVDNSGNKVIRLDYGSDPLNTSPTVVDLGDAVTVMSNPEDISMIQYGGNWYGVVGYEDNSGSITRLDFGTSLTNTPTETSLGNFGFTGRIRNVGLEEVDGSLLLLFTHYNTNELVIVNYDNSFDKVIDNATDVYRSGAISDLRFTTGFDFRQLSNGNYVAHLVSIADEDVVRLDYGTDLYSTPTQSATYTLSGLTASYNFQMLEEGGSYYGVIGSSDQAIKLYDFGDLTTTQQPVELSYTTALPTNEAFALYRYEGSSYFKGIDRSTITNLSFVASCDASISSSTDETPAGVNYGTAGSYELQLYAFDSDGDVTTATETVTVLNQSAPAIDFTINDSQCISSDNVFTPSNTGLSTYNWTLGDGNSSTDVTPTHRYPAAGTYSVILEVSDGTCTNTSTETLTIYDDPPTPTFTVTNSSGSLCSNTELTLDNTTDETGYDDALTYRWLIDGDQAFQADTVYTFTTSGDKTITLQSFVPGCSSTITEEVITIGDGPEVSFNYTNNCFGSPVEFTGEAVGSGVSSYTWDFGDGSATETGSALTSPTHTYSTAGSYTVTLSVSNSDGCTTISTQDITVTDADLVSFTNSEATENTLISFTGVDETVAGDAVTSWSWDFAGEGSSTDQSPTFTFTAPGSYDVSVTVNTDQGCSSTVTETITVAEAAFPTAAFTLGDTELCLSEDLQLTNTSINATSYEWDFCLGDFAVEPTTSEYSITGLSNGFGVELLEDEGMYYGFVVDNSGNKVIRLDYGSDPLNTSPTVVDLGDAVTVMSNPEDISMIQYGGNWYGVVGYEDNSGSITRLDFGPSLTNTPTETSLGNFGFTGRIRNVGLEEVDGSLLLLFTHYNTNELVIVNYDNSFDKVIDNATDVYSSGAISDLNFTTGFDFRQLSNGNYVAHLVSIADEDVVRLDYGTDLFSTPTQSATYTLSGLTASYNFQMLEEGGNYYGVIGSSDQAIKLYDFGDLTTTQQPVELSYTTALPTNEAFALYRYEGSSYFKGIAGSTITDLSFVASCDASISSSTDETPTGVNYGTAGSYEIQLYAFDSDGDVTTATETVTVLNQSAPAIDFTINDSQCISSDNVFTPSNTGLSTYNWTLGDGNSSTDVTPTHRYAAAGTYSVILEVSDGTCTNTSTETLTIYDDPPTPTFTVTNSSGSLCSNTELTLDNTTDETGYDDALTYRWLIDGDQAFQADTVYKFTTSGDKTITLQSFVPGCSSTITEEVITIGDGPEVSFNYTNNCFGSPVEFTGEAVGSGVSSYTWDFGDGSATETGSALTSPTHTYSTAGSYTVTLSVSNSDGCTTISTQDITVTDADLVSFTNSEATENTLISFTGVDETVAGDAVTSWSWDFAGEGSSTDQSPTFTFTAPGSYDVSVTVNTDQGCSSTVTETITVAEAAFPTAAFTLGDTELCLSEDLQLTNTSINATSYEWDFCLGDFAVEPTTSEYSITGLSNGFGVELLEDEGMYYGFVVDNSGNKVIRLDYGSDPLNTSPKVVDLGDAATVMSNPEDISMIQYGGNWYGVVGYEDNSGSITRLDFGTSLTNTPTETSLGNFGFTGRIRNVDLEEVDGSLLLLFTHYNTNELVIVNYDNSFDKVIDNATDVYSSGAISDLNFTTGFDFRRLSNGNYVAHLVSIVDEDVVRLDYGTDLFSTPTQSATYTLSGLTTSYNFQMLEEGGSYYGVIGSSDQAIKLYDFGDLTTTQQPVELTYTSALPTNEVFTMYRYEGSSYIKGIDGSTLTDLAFIASCGTSILFSAEESPSEVNYSANGDYAIQLYAFDAEGDVSITQETVTVLDQNAPAIDFSIDESRCIDNANTFTASTDIYNYSWDFNGEGTGTNAEETFQFTSAGPKQVILTINDGTCTNTVEETITVYDVPPVPDFDISGNICQSTSLEITNSTEDTDWGDAISYVWTFNGDSMVTADQPNFAFTGAGAQAISVVAEIPGCVSEAATQAITVNDLPITDYSISPTCDLEVTNFTNLTTGATNYSWDFGDGFTSTQTSPAHLYQTPGDYEVSMVATNSTGCSDTLTQIFSVDFLPEAGFRAQLPCEGSITLIDTSSVAASDIISWNYSIASIEQLFEDQNPELLLNEPGDYEITQEVTSSAGCTSNVTQIITVQDAADPAIQVDAACFGDNFHFTDISDISTGNRVISRIWNFEGQNIEIADTSIVDIDYVFSAPGTYEVSLTLTTQNLCTSSISRSVTVLERPVLAFDTPQICQNDFATFSDLSTSVEDDIVSRQWILNGALIGNGTSVSHKFTVDGENDIWLVTTTAQGCIDTLDRKVNVLSAPEASFEASSNFGVEGSLFSFTNTSTGSLSHQWLVDDQPASTDFDFETNFDNSGNREVSLIAYSEFSCSDTTSIDVLVRVPEIDLALTGMRLVPLDDSPEFSVIQVSVENNSNLPVNRLRFSVELEDQLPFQREENVLVPIGESRSFELDLNVPNQASYICVEVSSAYESEDVNSQNNSLCENFEPQPVFPPVYPNPATDEISVDTVLPSEGDVTISLLDASGKVEIQERYTDLNEGLQSFRVELAPYKPGIYFIRIAYGEFVEIKRIVKQ